MVPCLELDTAMSRLAPEITIITAPESKNFAGEIDARIFDQLVPTGPMRSDLRAMNSPH